MAVRFLIPVLVTMMLVTGVCNTLLTKYQDNVCVRECDNPNPKERKLFEQPVIQTAQMFIGEMGCWLIVGCMALYRRYIARGSWAEGYQAVSTSENGVLDNDADSILSTTPIIPTIPTVKIAKDLNGERLEMKGWKVMLLALPAICDICGTTLMNVGLLFVVPSIYQMTRGALVLFVGLLSVLFLRKRLYLFQWSALFTVVLGVGIVGLAGAIYKDEKAAPATLLLIREAVTTAARAARTPEAIRTIVGVFLIAGAQIFTASQFVLEEHILEKYAMEPIKAVGWEGVFGFSVTVVGMLVLHLAIGRTDAGRYGYFDLVEGLRQMTEYREIWFSSILIMISIGGFNFFGLSVTRSVSATSRSTIDTCRTLFIWIVSLFLGWETFKVLQLLGFFFLVYGTFLFNSLVPVPMSCCLPSWRQEDDVVVENDVEGS